MHRLAVGGCVMGAVFAIGSVLIFVVGVPAGRWFLLASFLVGIGVAALLQVWHKRHPVELTQLEHLSSPNRPNDNNRC